MATVVSLTQTKIEELMAGWEGVELSQDEINSLVGQLWVDTAAHGANLEEFENVTLPALQDDLNASSTAVSNLGDQIPDLETAIEANESLITNLNTVTIPFLQGELTSANNWILELNEEILPELYTQLDANNVLITEFNTVTLPDLNSRLTAVEGSAGFDPTELNAAIDALEGKFPVVGDDIAADTITSNNIEAHTITALEIAADTITANEIAADTITANEIASHTITAAEIFADTITANEIATDTITANEIAADTITANEIAADSITASEIAADTITANEIATDAITALEIAADTITANEIATDTITANEIATDTITANEIATGTITALEIAGGTITGEKIAADTIAVTKLIVSDLTNLVVDGDLLDPTSATWFEMGPTSMIRVKNSGEPAYMKNTNTYHTQYVYFRNENVFEVKVGDEFFVSMEVSTPASNTVDASFNPYLAVFDQNGGSQLWRGIEEGAVSVPPDTPWTVIEGTIKLAESGLATAQFNPIANFGTGLAAGTQEFRVRKMQVRRKGTGKLVVDGSIEGKSLKINTITSDHIDTKTLTGDLFAAEMVFAGLMRAGELDEAGLLVSGYSEMGSNGIWTVDTAGSIVAKFPTDAADGAFLKAHVELLSADVRDNFTMHGTNNAIATEAELTLSAGVEAPSVPPVLQEVWDTIQLNTTTAVPAHTPNPGYNLGTFALAPSQIVSMTWDSVWSCWIVIQQKSTGFRVWRFTAAGAIYNNFGSGRPWIDDYNDRVNAAVCFDSNAGGTTSIFKQGEQWYCWGFTQAGVGVINKIPESWIIDAASRPPTLAYIASNNRYALVQNSGGGSGTIHVRQFTCNSGANFPNATSQSTTAFEAGSGLSERLNGALYGSQSGITGWTINSDAYSTVYVFNPSGVLQNDEGSYRCWVKPAASLGLTHNGTQYASVDSAGKITLYEDWTWLGVDNKVWVGASAADTTAGNGDLANPHVGQSAGQHETPVGKMVSIGLHRRSKLRATMPETNDSGAPNDPDKWKLYWKRGGNLEPTDKTLLKLMGTIGSPTASTSVTIGADPTGAAPPGGIKGQPDALNNFPGADPGRIESAKLMLDGIAQLTMKGDGTGRWGSLTVDANGKAVIGGDTGWINLTLVNGFVPYGSPYLTPSYRKIGSRVYLRGLADAGTAASTIATLPVGFRPVADEMFSTTIQQRSTDVAGDSIPTFTTSSTNSHQHNVNAPALDMSIAITNTASRLSITAAGVITSPGAGQPAGGWVSLSGISFMTD